MKAFPTIKEYDNHGRLINSDGMDLRDYFAAHFLANKWCVEDNPQETAEQAYKVADAMMKAREA